MEKIIYPTADIRCGTNSVVSRGNRKAEMARAVKRIRESRNLSLEDVRNRSMSNLSTSYVNRIETGGIDPDNISIGVLRRVAKGLGEPVQTLFDIAVGKDHEISPDEERLLFLARQLHPLRLRDIVDMAETFLAGQDAFLNAIKKGMLETKAPIVANIAPPADPADEIRRQLQEGIEVAPRSKQQPIPLENHAPPTTKAKRRAR